MDWTDGYVAEIDYTHGYYRELCPGILSYALTNAGYEHRLYAGGGQSREPIKYLELGFGQGVSLAIHAAAQDGEFWGNDFNPVHAANAQDLGHASGANITVLDSSFAELAERDDLPLFDVIALHGIWSWVSPENRALLVDIARKRLAVGGVFYVSYNCWPGWSAVAPLRHLMTLHADLVSGEAMGLVPRLDGALGFAQRLADANAGFFRANPVASVRLKAMPTQNKNYLAHEYLNKHWHTMHFAEVAAELEQAKLSFATSAHLLDHFNPINLSAESMAILEELRHPVLRESVRDFFVNQQFRRDIFVKGPRTLSPSERTRRLSDTVVVLATNPNDIELKVQGAIGEGALHEQVYRPIIASLAAKNAAPKSLGELAAGLPDLSIAQVIEAVTVMIGVGHVSPAHSDKVRGKVQKATRALNAALCDRSGGPNGLLYLASPVSGGGMLVPMLHQLFLKAIAHGKKDSAQWAQAAWETLAFHQQRLIKDGATLQTAEENLKELNVRTKEFAEKNLPVYRAMGLLA